MQVLLKNYFRIKLTTLKISGATAHKSSQGLKILDKAIVKGH